MGCHGDSGKKCRPLFNSVIPSRADNAGPARTEGPLNCGVITQASLRDPGLEAGSLACARDDERKNVHCKINLRLRMRSAPMIWRNFCKSSSIDLLIMV